MESDGERDDGDHRSSKKPTACCQSVYVALIIPGWLAFIIGFSFGFWYSFLNAFPDGFIDGFKESFSRNLEETFQRGYMIPPADSQCPDGWLRSQGKCYYFSKTTGNWNYSRNFCSSDTASLARIESLQELVSQLPYPGRLDHWIGLRKRTDGVWRWVNGTEFDRRFEIRGGADCAYLDEDLTISSSSCSTRRKWLCSKHDAPTQGDVFNSEKGFVSSRESETTDKAAWFWSL